MSARLHDHIVRSPRFVVSAAGLIPVLLFFSCGGHREGTEATIAPPVEISGPVEREEPKLPAVAIEEPETTREEISESEIPEVRVLILETRDRISVEVESGELSFIDAGGNVALSWEIGGDLRFNARGDEVGVSGGGGPSGRSSSISITASGGSFIRIEGRPYRGRLLLATGGGRGLLAINILGMEDYIRGVLPSEIGYLKQGQYEAFRAQAIASRSYALSKLDGKKDELYDLRSTVMDQVYKGVEGENAEASRAVDETAGVVGLWNGKPITAYYSACCGGHTADTRVGWPWKTDYPYLHGVRDAQTADGRSFCRESRHFRWEAAWSGETLLAILKKTLSAELGTRVASFRRIVDIGAEGLSTSGRVNALRVVTDSGSYRVEGDRIRWVLRPGSADGPILRSTLFKMEVDRGAGRVVGVRVKGGGNGHGTGMCQSGAVRMAELGYSAAEILLHYYPGITIGRVY